MVKFSDASNHAGSSAIRDILEVTEQPHVLSLAGGLPHPGTFPAEAVGRAVAAVLRDDPPAALQYGPTDGLGPLRAWVADRWDAAVGQVLITHGSQQALSLLATTLIDPGDTIALADPAYVGAVQTFDAHRARLAPVASDRAGMVVDDLAAQLADGLQPKLVYVVANFDNPTGTTLPVHRRHQLAALADHHGFLIVEDDPYGELRWAGTPAPPIRSFTDRVVSLGTTSKVLCPGLRVGWAVAPLEVQQRMATLKQAADLHTGSLDQQIAHRVLSEPGFLGPHLDLLRRTYQAQADALTSSLAARLGDRLRFHQPDGGMFVWAHLADGVASDRHAADLLRTCVDHGVAFVPGSAFAVGDGHERDLRLSFATMAPAQLDEAVARLAGVLDAA